MADEFARIDRIARILGSKRSDVLLGIGDDAAVLAPSAGPTVLTVDASVEDVHFRRAWMSFEDIGYRATVAATSDVLAMGARPTVAVAAWTIPAEFAENDIDALARGQRAAADALGLVIVGGNLSRGPSLSITTTVLGALGVAARPIPRSGARAGDRLAIAGAVGEAALGLRALELGRADEAPRAVAAFRRPPVQVGVHLERALAALDVSDGLAQDVGHLAKASGLRAVIDVAAVRARRAPEIDEAAKRLGVDQDLCELSGGEDYALVGAFTAQEALPAGFDPIGFLEAGEGVELLVGGVRSPAPLGYRHQ